MATQPTQAEVKSNNVTGMDNFSKILDKKVDLITNSNIRYEGVLIKIKTEDQRLLLKDVKSYGTEGRNNGVNEVPTPSPDDPNNLYAFVEFQIPMIKELYLAKVEGPVPEDPAIVAVGKESIETQQEEPAHPGEKKLERFKPDIPAGSSTNNFFDDESNELESDDFKTRGYRGYRRGRGRGRGRGGYRGGHGHQSRGRGGNRSRYNPHGKFEKNPDHDLQEKFKDDFFK